MNDLEIDHEIGDDLRRERTVEDGLGRKGLENHTYR